MDKTQEDYNNAIKGQEMDKVELSKFEKKKYNLMSLWGGIILGCGIIATLASLNMDTGNPGSMVYNVGLLNNKTNAVIISQTIVLSGVI